MKLLEVKSLNIYCNDKNNIKHLVKGLSFHVNRGEIFGIVGESGCGKSLTSKSILRVLEKHFLITGEVEFEHENILEFSEKKISSLRGNKISMILQDSSGSLNPLKKIGKQIEECLLIHRKNLSKCERMKVINDILEECELAHLENILNRYPHELSGGQRQRVVIAMAVICEPSLVICDECTTALDLRIQLKVVRLLKKMNKDKNMTIIFVSHDMALIDSLCDRVMVMYGGEKVEIVENGLVNAKDKYTQTLYNMIFSMEDKNKSLPTLEKRGVHNATRG
ncbi:ABC transporter ATP-binding protein [uncultured Cetobacterium sp.]|uniref:ABC transporter ATP-binding protein n=2 Tax=uncultured Cetobacterium sp. TaxID=527638 RepID=UPI00260AD04B|nr:ABC transporter ATP-binding protein [uncultured Cetobacterium sp.]